MRDLQSKEDARYFRNIFINVLIDNLKTNDYKGFFK